MHSDRDCPSPLDPKGGWVIIIPSRAGWGLWGAARCGACRKILLKVLFKPHWGPTGPHGAPRGPTGPHGGFMGSHGAMGPHGAPWGPMGPLGLMRAPARPQALEDGWRVRLRRVQNPKFEVDPGGDDNKKSFPGPRTPLERSGPEFCVGWCW